MMIFFLAYLIISQVIELTFVTYKLVLTTSFFCENLLKFSQTIVLLEDLWDHLQFWHLPAVLFGADHLSSSVA